MKNLLPSQIHIHYALEMNEISSSIVWSITLTDTHPRHICRLLPPLVTLRFTTQREVCRNKLLIYPWYIHNNQQIKTHRISTLSRAAPFYLYFSLHIPKLVVWFVFTQRSSYHHVGVSYYLMWQYVPNILSQFVIYNLFSSALFLTFCVIRESFCLSLTSSRACLSPLSEERVSVLRVEMLSLTLFLSILYFSTSNV